MPSLSSFISLCKESPSKFPSSRHDFEIIDLGVLFETLIQGFHNATSIIHRGGTQNATQHVAALTPRTI